MKTTSTFLLSILVFVGAAIVFPRGFIPDTNLGAGIVTVVTFLFGILGGFYIIVTTTDYNSFKTVVAEETAGWISLYQNIVSYDRRLAQQLSDLIDLYIIRSFDSEIIEYVRWTQPEFQKIDVFLRRLPIKNRLAGVYDKIKDTFAEVVVKRQMLTVLSTRTLSFLQWTVLYILAGLLVLVLYGIRDGHLFSNIVAVAVSSAIILILMLVRELDLFLWNEKSFGFDPYQNVLVTIGKLPYYADLTVKSRRIAISEPVYRVGETIGRNPTGRRRKIRIVKQETKKLRSR